MTGANAISTPARVLGFPPDSHVDVRAIGDEYWDLLRELPYHATELDFVVPECERTDFASVPRLFVWFLPRYGRYTRAAILHDYLLRARVRAGDLSRRDADGIFHQALRELGVPFLRRWMMWAAVRWVAVKEPGERAGWWKDVWRILPITIVALPIVAPAAIVIAITIPVFYVLERILYAVLLVAQRMQRRQGREAKRVNEPQLRWKL